MPGRTQPSPPLVEFNEEAEYEVEGILDSLLKRRKLYYLVRWKGYTPDHDV